MTSGNRALAHDPTAGIDHHRPDDRFIPIRSSGLVAALAADAAHLGPDAQAVAEVAEVIEDIIEQEAGAFERELADHYAAFNPDRDTICVKDVAKARTAQGYTELERRLHYLLEKANFEQLSEVQIEAAVHAANTRGLRVRLDPERVRQLAVWVRGQGETERRQRTMRKPLRGELRRVSVYRRVAVIARLRDDPHVLLKMFKEIPAEDLEALLPHAEIQMTWFDRIKLMGGGAGMVGTTATKVFKLATTALVFSRLLWVLMAGAGLLLFRTFMGYRNVRTQRDLQRTTNLYYQNLGNNAAVIHSLVSMIAQEEVKEAVLAYAFCQAAPEPIGSAKSLAQRIESYLAERFDAHFVFDVPDALESITRLNLWADPERLQVVPPPVALERLRRHRRERRSRGYHATMAQRGQSSPRA